MDAREPLVVLVTLCPDRCGILMPLRDPGSFQIDAWNGPVLAATLPQALRVAAPGTQSLIDLKESKLSRPFTKEDSAETAARPCCPTARFRLI